MRWQPTDGRKPQSVVLDLAWSQENTGKAFLLLNRAVKAIAEGKTDSLNAALAMAQDGSTTMRRELVWTEVADSLLDAWLHGRLDVDIAGAFFGSSFVIRRSLPDVKPGGVRPDQLRKVFVCMGWGCSAPTVAYLCLPDPEGTPKGSIHLLDEFYVAASTAGGQRDWTRGTYLSNAEQAVGIIEWLSRWGLRPGSTKVVADDAVFNSDGRGRGATAGDFRATGCP